MKNHPDVRAILEAHAQGEYHRGFRTRDGAYYEGYFWVDEDEDVIHFAAGGPMGGWEKDFPFDAIDLDTLVPPVTLSPDGEPQPGA